MEPRENTLLVPKNRLPHLRHKSENISHSVLSCRALWLLIPALLLALYLCNQISEPNTVLSPWLLVSHKHHKHDEPHGHNKDCKSDHFKKETLKELMEFPFQGLFREDGISKYEASDVVMTKDTGEAIVVFDNVYSIGKIGHPHMHNASRQARMSSHGPSSLASLLKWSKQTTGDSMFEFITFNETAGAYIVGQEGVNHDDGKERAVTFDVTFSEGMTNVGTRCVADFEFSHSNTGFEGAIVVTTKKGESLLVGLCEGNYCSGGDKGRKAGNGRLVVMRRVDRKGECRYETVEIVKLPSEVDFEDYSAITLWKETTVAIASQQNSAMFIGEFELDDGVKVGKGRIVDFPRNDECEIKYCNIEGIAFIGEKSVLAVSDSMKSRGKQHFRCREKDESIALFQLM